MKHSRSFLLATLAALAGCGGHGGSKGSSSRSGKIAFSVNWPAQSRYIPTAANFIRITISRSGDADRRLDFLRSDVGSDGGTDTKTLAETLPDGAQYTLTANAYAKIPASSGAPITENPLATSSAGSVTVVAGETRTTTLTMASNLTQFKVALTNLVTGASIGSSPFTLGSSPIAGPPIKSDVIVKATITPQNTGGNVLILYPTGTNPTTTLSVTGNLEAVLPTVVGNDLVATIVPKNLSAGASPIQVTFADPDADPVDGTPTPDPTISGTLSATTTALTISPTLGTARTPFDAVTGLAASPTKGYAITQSGVVYSLTDLTAGTSTALVGGPFVVSAANDVVALGAVGGALVTQSGTARTNVVPSGLKFLTQFESANYAVSVQGNSVTVSKIDFTRPIGSTAAVVGTFDSGATVTALAIGRDLATGGPAFYTIEGTSVNRYTSSGAGFAADPSFPPTGFSVATPIALGADGNLVWVLGSNKTVTFVTLNGKVAGTSTTLSSLPGGATVTGISVHNGASGGIGSVSYTQAGTATARTFAY